MSILTHLLSKGGGCQKGQQISSSEINANRIASQREALAAPATSAKIEKSCCSDNNNGRNGNHHETNPGKITLTSAHRPRPTREAERVATHLPKAMATTRLVPATNRSCSTCRCANERAPAKARVDKLVPVANPPSSPVPRPNKNSTELFLNPFAHAWLFGNPATGRKTSALDATRLHHDSGEHHRSGATRHAVRTRPAHVPGGGGGKRNMNDYVLSLSSHFLLPVFVPLGT